MVVLKEQGESPLILKQQRAAGQFTNTRKKGFGGGVGDQLNILLVIFQDMAMTGGLVS